MGIFGHKIFDDDFALDARDAYLDCLFDGMTSEEATAKLEDDFSASLEDADEAPVFWLAVAETQWDKGRLVDKTLKNALRVLDEPVCPETWGQLTKRRRAELARLRKKLEKKQPKEKRLVRRVPTLSSGDVFRFSLEKPGADGQPVYYYGRVLTDHHAVFYSNDSLRNVRTREYMEERQGGNRESRPRSSFELRDVLEMDVAFIGSCYAGFYARKYRLIGNIPLEPRFKKPIRFYHRPVASSRCEVFDIWKPNEPVFCDISELDPQIERWCAADHEYVLQRLGILGR